VDAVGKRLNVDTAPSSHSLVVTPQTETYRREIRKLIQQTEADTYRMVVVAGLKMGAKGQGQKGSHVNSVNKDRKP